MATNFPGSLDTFTNPTSSSTLDSPSHAAQHANINDAMEAVQTKLGTGAGTIGEWTSFTPSWTNLTVGNGTVEAAYAIVNKVLFCVGNVILGSTSSVGTAPYFDTPVNEDTGLTTAYGACGTAIYRSPSSHLGILFLFANRVYFQCLNLTATNYGAFTGITASVPQTWGSGDRISWNLSYPIP